MPTIGILTNPKAGAGRRSERAEALARAVGDAGVVVATRDVSEIGDALETFRRNGCSIYVADGGDGTLGWLLSTWFDRYGRSPRARSGEPPPRFVPTCGGSINFVARHLGLSGDGLDLVTRLAERVRSGAPIPERRLSTLEVVLTRPDGSQVYRVGFAAALCGVAQRFFDVLYEHRPVRPAHIARVLAVGAAGPLVLASGPVGRRIVPRLAERARFLYGATHARVTVDGRPVPFERLRSVQVGAFRIDLGGVVRAFRLAGPNGRLHAQVVGLSPGGVAANLPNVILGTPLWGSRVVDAPCRRLHLAVLSGATPDPVVDGEIFRNAREIRVCTGPHVSFAVP